MKTKNVTKNIIILNGEALEIFPLKTSNKIRKSIITLIQY